MKMRPLTITATSIVALTMATSGFAADADMKAGVRGETNAVTSQPMPGKSNVGRAANIDADKLLGEPVRNPDGDTIGEVDSVIVDQGGKVQAVVVSVGGFLGLGEHHVALDWNDLQIDERGEEVRAPYSKEQLKAMPAYRYRDGDKRGVAFVDDRYRNDGVESMADRDAGKPQLKESASADAVMDNGGNLKATELIGMEVVGGTANRDVVGEIEEILVSQDGKLHAVLGAGGFLGIGEKKLLVSWDRLQVVRNDKKVQIRTALSADDLRKMPYGGDLK